MLDVCSGRQLPRSLADFGFEQAAAVKNFDQYIAELIAEATTKEESIYKVEEVQPEIETYSKRKAKVPQLSESQKNDKVKIQLQEWAARRDYASINSLRRPEKGSNKIKSVAKIIPCRNGMHIEFQLSQIYKCVPTPAITNVRELLNTVRSVEQLQEIFGVYKRERELGKIVYKIRFQNYTGVLPAQLAVEKREVHRMSAWDESLVGYALYQHKFAEIHQRLPDLGAHPDVDEYDSTEEASQRSSPVQFVGASEAGVAAADAEMQVPSRMYTGVPSNPVAQAALSQPPASRNDFMQRLRAVNILAEAIGLVEMQAEEQNIAAEDRDRLAKRLAVLRSAKRRLHIRQNYSLQPEEVHIAGRTFIENSEILARHENQNLVERELEGYNYADCRTLEEFVLKLDSAIEAVKSMGAKLAEGSLTGPWAYSFAAEIPHWKGTLESAEDEWPFIVNRMNARKEVLQRLSSDQLLALEGRAIVVQALGCLDYELLLVDAVCQKIADGIGLSKQLQASIKTEVGDYEKLSRSRYQCPICYEHYELRGLAVVRGCSVLHHAHPTCHQLYYAKDQRCHMCRNPSTWTLVDFPSLFGIDLDRLRSDDDTATEVSDSENREILIAAADEIMG